MTDDLNAEATNAEPPHPLPAKYLLMADILHMMVACLLLSLFLFTGTEVPLLFQLALSAVIFVVMIRGGGWLALAAMQVSMFFYETRFDYPSMQLSTIMFSVFCLAYVAYATGFRTIRRLLRDWLGRMLHLWLDDPRPAAQRNALSELDVRQDKLVDWLWLREHSGQMLMRSGRLLLIVIVASVVFIQLPITMPGIRSWWNRTVDMNFMMWPGANVFTIAILCILAITVGAWRRLNPVQARLYLKSLYVREHFRELRSVLVRSRQLDRWRPFPISKKIRK